MTEKTDNIQIKKDRPWLWKKGQSGNLAGKPKGAISPIQRVKQIFLRDPKLFKDFIEEYIKDPNNRRHIVEMIDGKPKQNVDLTTGGQSFIPTAEERSKALKALEDIE